MATFFSGQTVGYWSRNDNNIYATLTGDVTRSGNTVTLSNMWLQVWFRLSSYGVGAFSFTVNGTTTAWQMQAASPSHAINSTSFGVSTTQTSAVVGWSGIDGTGGSFTVTFPSGAVAPNTPTVSAVANDSHSISVTYGTSSFGVPSSGTVYLYGGTGSSPSTQIASKNSTGSSTFIFNNLNPNTTYYFRSNASNGQLWSGYSGTVSVKTKAGNYVPVNGKSRSVRKYYAPISGKSRSVLKLYDSHNGKSRRIY